ncbi:MAG: sigma 54-interacting transcriptional regulator [Planctomycetota bacterium]
MHLPADPTNLRAKTNRQVVEDAWHGFKKDYKRIFDIGSGFALDTKAMAHLFACLTQVHRAFFNIFDHILGESLPITRLRKKVWESIFTCSIRRYHDSLFGCMRDLSTLVTGPSGTGKELVARAIGLSQYVPFNAKTCQFDFDSSFMFLPLNLTALSPTLIESELFGHCKGAFTGAVEDRTGWLESCSQYGAVFLDEIGDLDIGLQVKLLRVLQQRTYCRLGETEERIFQGKIVAATNRNLAEEIGEHRFREDFYFRLCADRIETPSLREQLDDCPKDLDWLVQCTIRKMGVEDALAIGQEVAQWINANLGPRYGWSGNIRELEQCIRSYLIRGEYTPLSNIANYQLKNELPKWLSPLLSGNLSSEQLMSRYSTWLYFKEGSYEKTAQILKVDRRTVKAKIDPKLLEELQK